jgi:hypothetical protein
MDAWNLFSPQEPIANHQQQDSNANCSLSDDTRFFTEWEINITDNK